MSKRDFLALEDWGIEEVEALLTLAGRIKRGEVSGGLERKILAMVLMDPSLRTRTSFEAAMFLHGAIPWYWSQEREVGPWRPSPVP